MDQSAALVDAEYSRARYDPKPTDGDYLVLSDLLLAIRNLVPQQPGRMLDFGCGGSPYRRFFDAALYHRADLSGVEDLDFEFDLDSSLPPDVGGYDFVLSTQVLEHVQDPSKYLSECHRVLASSGSLLISTHGTFWDHSCPHDYWRWTAAGLSKQVAAAGFEVTQVKKLTAGARAVMYLAEHRGLAEVRGGGWLPKAYDGLLGVIKRIGAARFHAMADQCWPSCRVVDAPASAVSSSDNDLYVGVIVLAKKIAAVR